MAEPPKKTAVKADAYPNSASQQEFGCLLDSERNRAALQAPHEGIANVAARLVSLSAVVQACRLKLACGDEVSHLAKRGSRRHEAWHAMFHQYRRVAIPLEAHSPTDEKYHLIFVGRVVKFRISRYIR